MDNTYEETSFLWRPATLKRLRYPLLCSAWAQVQHLQALGLGSKCTCPRAALCKKWQFDAGLLNR